jgi:hypothetical protein
LYKRRLCQAVVWAQKGPIIKKYDF